MAHNQGVVARTIDPPNESSTALATKSIVRPVSLRFYHRVARPGCMFYLSLYFGSLYLAGFLPQSVAVGLFLAGVVLLPSLMERQLFDGRVLALRRARRALRRGDEQAVNSLLALTESPGSAGVRLEAAGYLALEALERGDLEEAVRCVAVAFPDERYAVRDRALGFGLMGELVRSILSRLSPSALPYTAEAASFATNADQRLGASAQQRREFGALLSALRVLEAVQESPDDDLVRRVWDESHQSRLGQYYPTLNSIVLALAARRLPELRGQLDALLHSDERASLISRILPELRATDLQEDAYRSLQEAPVEDDLAEATEHALALRAPTEVTALADAAAQPSIELWQETRVVQRALLASMAVGIFWSGAGSFISALLTAVLGMSAIVVGDSLWHGQALKARVWPLRQLVPPPARAWLREFERSGISRMGPMGRHELIPFPTAQMRLYVASVIAENELHQGQLDAAWKAISWWFVGLDSRKIATEPLYAVASTLMRVAVLSEHLDEAQRLRPALDHDHPQPGGIRRRTAFGDAPRARAFSLALLAAKEGDWKAVGSALAKAAASPRIYLPAHHRVLMSVLARRAREEGTWVSRRFTRVRANELAKHEAWIRRVFPELLTPPR